MPTSLSVLAAGPNTLYGLGRPFAQPSSGRGEVSLASVPTPADAYPSPGPDPGSGLLAVASDGGVFSFTDTFQNGGTVTLADAGQFCGSPGGTHLNRPVVGGTSVPGKFGYWLVASDGGVFSFGDAAFHGSTGNLRLNAPVVGMAPTAGGRGYWLVGSDGGIFSFGDAAFHGSTGGQRLNRPIVGMAATPDGRGYWLVASDGGVFSFGDAAFHGSTGNRRLDAPVVGIASTADGGGYWLAARDGGVFTFGDAPFAFSNSANPFKQGSAPTVGIATLPGDRYALVSADAQICSEGPALYSPGFPNLDRVVNVACDDPVNPLASPAVAVVG